METYEKNNDLIRQNVNFLEFPIWTINKDDKRAVFLINTSKGVYKYRANPEIGIPDSTDMDILYYFIKVSQEEGGNIIKTTFYDICKNTGFFKGGRMYSRIEKSLDIWSGVSIHFDENYYHPEHGYRKMWFHVFKAEVNNSKEKRRHLIKDIKVSFDIDFIESLKVAGLFDLMDFKLFVSLKNPLSKRLYEYLPKHFADNKNEFKISDGLLFDKLRLKKRRYRSDKIRQFGSITRALGIYNNAQDKHKFSFSYKQKNNSKTDFLCVFTEDKSDVKVNKTQQLPKSKTEKIENKTIKESEPNLNLDKELLEKLLHHGLKQNQISEFLNDSDVGLIGIEEGFNYYKRQLDAGKIHSNKSAYLFKSIKEKYGERTEDQKKEDEKESFKVKLNKKVDMFENHRAHGLNKKDMVELQNEIADMFDSIQNHGAASTWRDKDIDFIMR